jgi:Domain of unknown function (DUF1924)
MKILIPLLALLASPSLWAAVPEQFIASYSDEAARAQPGFTSSAALGKSFAMRKWGMSDKLASCSSCHTDTPRNPGRHAVTGKTIGPLSPAVNPERFSDAAKVEKWFKRNCKEVVGRACTAAEKANFIAFAKGGR